MHLRPSRQRLIASKSLFTFSCIVSIGTLLLYNVPFFGFVAQHTDEDGFGKIFLLASLVVVMLVLNFMMTYLVMWLLRFVGRILLALLAIINATALADDVEGYVSTTPVKIYIRNNKVMRVEALENEETPKYFDMMVEKGLLKKWNGQPAKTAEKQKVDAVSGATVSSEAVIENVRRGIAYYNYID